MMGTLTVLLVVVVLVVPSFAQTSQSSAPPATTGDHLRREIHKALAVRQQEYEALKTPEQIAAYQQRRRSAMLQALGDFPEKMPLNARVTGSIPCNGYRIEKILFESRPGLVVAALLYLPDSPPPYPASLVPCGHSENGKAYDSYQRVCILLARNGIAALCYDPPGQGERAQILNGQDTPAFGATIQHTLIGTGSILLGRSIATDIVWDGIRAIDYLQGRSDIDASRIACTGNSGGGTQSSYLMAIDSRITCAVPCCYLTSFARLVDTIGPQDAEQNIFGQIALGLDHADYAIMMAPRPLLYGTVTRDFFDIAGAWDNFRQAKRIYTRLGFPERVDLVEADLEHSFAKELRVPMVNWMRRWLLNVHEPVSEREAAVKSDFELNCTPAGQVMRLDGAKSLFAINGETETKLAALRRDLWQKTPRPQMLQQVRQLTGVRELDQIAAPAVEKFERRQHDGYTVTSVILRLESGIALPASLYEPSENSSEICLYLNGNGKDVDAAPGGRIEALVRSKRMVLAVDLPGIGLAAPPGEGGDWEKCFSANFKDFFMAHLLGRPYLGMRIESILACRKYLTQYAGDTPRQVHVIAIGEAGPAMLHAAALHPDLFASLRLERSLQSWAEVVRAPDNRNQLTNAVHGALRAYDLPDLVATLPVDTVQIVDPLDPSGRPAK
jgi:dienelactone hydrolase